MVTLTARAAAKVKQLEEGRSDPAQRLRLRVDPGGCSGFEYAMGFDTPTEDDQRMATEGVELIIDTASLEYLKGCEVDFDDGLNGKGFEIKNPNAQNTCGCGRSFS